MKGATQIMKTNNIIHKMNQKNQALDSGSIDSIRRVW